MHTEKEAKERWCPFARVFHYKFSMECPEAVPVPAHNRIVINKEDDVDPVTACDYGNLKCIASGCMAWRWDEERGSHEVEAGRPPLGFCGLSGKP